MSVSKLQIQPFFPVSSGGRKKRKPIRELRARGVTKRLAQREEEVPVVVEVDVEVEDTVGTAAVVYEVHDDDVAGELDIDMLMTLQEFAEEFAATSNPKHVRARVLEAVSPQIPLEHEDCLLPDTATDWRHSYFDMECNPKVTSFAVPPHLPCSSPSSSSSSTSSSSTSSSSTSSSTSSS